MWVATGETRHPEAPRAAGPRRPQDADPAASEFAGRWGGDAAGRQRRCWNAGAVDFGHRQVEGAQHGVAELVVAREAAAQAAAPRRNAAAGMQFEGGLAAIERGADMVGGELQQGG